MRRVLLALLLLAGSAGTVAVAQDNNTSSPSQTADEQTAAWTPSSQLPRQYYVSASAGYVLRDRIRQTNNGYGGTVALG